MPQKNRRFAYKADAYYHVYNRSPDKRSVFLEPSDYWAFRQILRESLEKFTDIKLLAFALLENHYHLLIFQLNERSIVLFMKSIGIRYAMYVAKKYNRSGRIFGSSYRAIPLSQSSQQRTVKRYILQNPIEAGLINWKHVGQQP